MILLLSSNLLLVSFPWRNLSSPTHLTLPRSNFTPISQTRLFSSKDDSFTASYLINSCGFSPESAELLSKHLPLKESSTPDSVFDFLKNYGFSDAHIKKVIKGYPRVLIFNAEKNLKPKMDFFLSIGVKADDLVDIICRNPTLLGCSLNKKIIPCYDFLKRILVHDELVVKSLKRSSRILSRNLEKNVVPNLELLKKVGVPDSNIQYCLVIASQLFCLDNAKFSKMVNRSINMGFDSSKYSFLQSIWGWPTKSTWERKAQVCRSWGWSDSDIFIAFRKNPNLMHKSVEKLTAVMDFYVNKMGCDPSDVAVASYVFSCSLEKSIIPKCSVIRVLQFKGLIRDKISSFSFMKSSNRKFLDRFVFKYLEQVPELLDIYQGSVDLSELGYGFEQQLDTKLEQLTS